MGKWLQKFSPVTPNGPTASVDTLTMSTLAARGQGAIEYSSDPQIPIVKFMNRPIFPTASVDTVTMATVSVDDPGEIWEERAAIIEYEAGIPRNWAEAFARVCCMSRPVSIPLPDWRRILNNIGRLLDHPGQLRNIIYHNWSVTDIFGIHPKAPIGRVDAQGLLLLLNDNEVVSIVDEKVIGLRNISSGNLLFYRKPLGASVPQVCIWQLTSPENRKKENYGKI